MYLTPNDALEHIKESVVQYLETAYKISHPLVFAERGEILRQRGVVAQEPFIEATPAFPTASRLIELERSHPQLLPEGLAELVLHGLPVDRFPLYTHQQESLLSAFSERPSLLVATGTGSGKTECFLLPILADVLREARFWAATSGPPAPGAYDEQTEVWLHSRRHETRPVALRSIILYPMNALVNDQLSRLRRILARGTSPDWQRRNLRGNVLHFGMYTGLSKPTGSWADKSRRDRFAEYIGKLASDWQDLREDLRATGSWPRPDSPEMLCRWDMQLAPPDILVTNYSMLEYMLVRPIESGIFERTREWLVQTPDARFTLVLDEAHTYTGAKGTEVAYLVRRLKERLGIAPGSRQFRAIATTASLPDTPGADAQISAFIGDLFGEPRERFTLVRPADAEPPPDRRPRPEALQAFARFHESFDIQDTFPAIEQLARDLTLGHVDRTLEPQIALHALLEKNEEVRWVRARTARRATLLDQLAEECWQGLGTPVTRERATAGVLSAGSFARAAASTDTPPLLSMRLHAFFRGIAGVWACTDPNCPEVPAHLRDAGRPRPVGKLYTDPRRWCGPRCGARVLELFSCRRCGLLFLGGIPDRRHGSLWPWSDDLSGERQEVRDFQIFGVECPHPALEPSYRSTRTTLEVHQNDIYARPVYEIEPATDNEGQPGGNFPRQCPRCQNYRQPGLQGREIIEPLRTRGPRSFSNVIEAAFRVQPRAQDGAAPNYGRKALLFTDSRPEAAILAADLRNDHASDLFRQLLYRALHVCDLCSGTGEVEETGPYVIGQAPHTERVTCPECEGNGMKRQTTPMGYAALRAQVLSDEHQFGIDPTNGEMQGYFHRLEAGDYECESEEDRRFQVALRREISESDFSLEPLGLASWQVRLPLRTGTFPPLSEPETRLLLRAIARILATEDILLPPRPLKPWEWPRDLVRPYDRQVIIPGGARHETAFQKAIPYNLEPKRKLGRYVRAVARALTAAGRLSDAVAVSKWLHGLQGELWTALQGHRILEPANDVKINNQVPFGIRIDSFELHPLGDTVEQCQACAYVMSEALLHVCVRCGQTTRSVPSTEISSYYRRAAFYALPNCPFDDPYPLRAIEHTAQIPGLEARDLERWFQDLFHDHQNRHDHRIDVLSVTTTMEMGIDIGSLLSVGLRNVPPTVANYQQRAGRAGRRGSSVATVLTFAQPRSHDQYYFAVPPEIVTEPPRVPMLYLQNEVIARRHVRSLVLHDFFSTVLRSRSGSGLFASWGTVAEFARDQTVVRFQQYMARNRAPLLQRCNGLLPPVLRDRAAAWIDALIGEVQEQVSRRDADEGLLEVLIGAGLLPKYAFPVDVVALSIPQLTLAEEGFEFGDDGMQRDLKIGIAEYAPGAEVVRGSFPNTYIYRSAGVYDRFSQAPDYSPTGLLVECLDCQSIELLSVSATPSVQCRECQSLNVQSLPYLRPAGFTVDAALPEAGRELYKGGGRERAGYTAPARLQVGETAFNNGRPCTPFAPRLYTHVRVGDLFIANRGVDREFPGFLICPACGRCLEPDHPGPHAYPADVPPHRGRNRGPRAGERCPQAQPCQNQALLGHRFHSEVILLGVDLPSTMDAPFGEPSGKAVWYSFGTLVADAAARELQVDPSELKVGVRAVRRAAGRIHGEVFIYDDVPGGAGYAREIERHLERILRKALELGRHCSNADCSGACYFCMFDYRNQLLHPLLDRELGTTVLEYLLAGKQPTLPQERARRSAAGFQEFARAGWTVQPERTVGRYYFPCVLADVSGQRCALWVVHPLQARPESHEKATILAQYGLRCAVHTSFDVDRRPFWVFNNLIGD